MGIGFSGDQGLRCRSTGSISSRLFIADGFKELQGSAAHPHAGGGFCRPDYMHGMCALRYFRERTRGRVVDSWWNARVGGGALGGGSVSLGGSPSACPIEG